MTADKPSHRRILLPLLFTVLVLTACTRKEDQAFGLAPQSSPFAAPPVAQIAAAGLALLPTADRPRSDTLAYEHSVAIELTKELMNVRIQEIQAACQSDTQSGCTLLDVGVSSHEYIPSGNIRLRLAPNGVDSLIQVAAKGGKIVSRSTHAEDLAEPVADTERQLALLTTHRTRLEELMKNRSLTVDQLITVSRELAGVQTQVEQFGTTRANLRRRIDTELLTINLSVPQREFYAQQSPVLDALRSFGTDLKQAFASVIRFIAVIVPWLIIIVPGVLLFRWLWRRAGLRLQKRAGARA